MSPARERAGDIQNPGASADGDLPGRAVSLLDQRALVRVRAVPAGRLDERPGRGGGDTAEEAAVRGARGRDLGPLCPVVVLDKGRAAAGLASGVGIGAAE